MRTSPSKSPVTHLTVLTKSCLNMKTEGTRFHLRGADNLPKVDVHPRIAIHQMPVVRFTILQLHELRSQNIRTIRTNRNPNEESHYRTTDRGRSEAPGSYHGMPLGGLEEREGKLQKSKKSESGTLWGSTGESRGGGEAHHLARVLGIKNAGSKERNGAGRSPAQGGRRRRREDIPGAKP
jgi:hypothetical protein